MYGPSAIPDDAPRGLKAWLVTQLRQISAELTHGQPQTVTLATLGVEPPRPRDGMIVYADGTEWNPGAGEGFYGYQAGAWVKL